MDTTDISSRARGCMLGQLAGDALGSLVEFQSPEAIALAYPGGVRVMHDGGHWNTIAGQPTDDSEMALSLARFLLATGGVYSATEARASYVAWLRSQPFDYGMTTRMGLQGRPNVNSQANGALMRVSPIGIWGARAGVGRGEVARVAMEDAQITHPNPVCQQANAIYALAVRDLIGGASPRQAYDLALAEARAMDDPEILETLVAADAGSPADFMSQQGWVRVALQNAFYQLLHAPTLEAGVVDTIGRGGDTDTNGAIAGALLGAAHGDAAIPQQWRDAVLGCRPEAGSPRVHRPRPSHYWPVDALELADALSQSGPAPARAPGP